MRYRRLDRAERTAGALTKTAETTQQLSDVVAAASEPPDHRRKVAAATGEMTGSVSEISARCRSRARLPAKP